MSSIYHVMRDYCSLDLLLVEWLHTVFTYFLAYEILLTSADVSNYINTVSLSYASYRLNFRSIRKCDFDLVCRHIPPDQVISPVLSDDNTELFSSCFRIVQSTDLVSILLPNLRHWKLPKCSIDQLEIIKSLDISRHIKIVDSKFVLPRNQLVQLNLKIEIFVWLFQLKIFAGFDHYETEKTLKKNIYHRRRLLVISLLIT